MNISKNERNFLNELSKNVYGSQSRWNKILEKGIQVLVTEPKEETVPGVDGAPDTVRTVDVPVLNKQGQKQYTVKYLSVEEVLQTMMDLKKQLDEIRAEFAKQKAEAQAKAEAAKKAEEVHKHLAGSAV